MQVTLGLEEELQVIDARTHALVPHDFDAGQRSVPDAFGTSSREIHRCALEVQTPVCHSVNELLASLTHLRGIAQQRASLQDQQVISAGLHPTADWRTQLMYGDAQHYPHYAQLLAEYGDVSRGALSFGLHLHFGLPDPSLLIQVFNRLRHRLPEVLALSASSPFHEKRDTGMHTWRHAVLDRFPRMGMPDEWPDEASYWNHVERLRALNILSAKQGMWEDMRLHHQYRTLEVRICDATPSLDRVWLIATLLLCEIQTLVVELASGTEAATPLHRALLAENRWLARRHGLNTVWVDFHRDELVPTQEHFARWLQRLRPAAEARGVYEMLTSELALALQQGTSADEQRRIYQETQDWSAVTGHLVEQTQQPLSAHLHSAEVCV
jgi:glutamate---cysteine ligase / carboxylate-amine ligase